MSYGSVEWNKRVVAVDYDETISAHETGWLKVLYALEQIGYTVVIVTFRKPDCYPEDLQFLIDKGYKVFFTSQVGKREYMRQQGYTIDVWIDDTPASVLFDYDTKTGKYIVDEARVL